jgi:hypothetical protein
MLEGEFYTKLERFPSTVNAKCLLMTYTKNFCITYARVSMTVVSGDGFGGSYHCGDTSSREEKISAPLGPYVSCDKRSFPTKVT